MFFVIFLAKFPICDQLRIFDLSSKHESKSINAWPLKLAIVGTKRQDLALSIAENATQKRLVKVILRPL